MGELIEKLNCCGGGPPWAYWEWMESAHLLFFFGGLWPQQACGGNKPTKKTSELTKWMNN